MPTRSDNCGASCQMFVHNSGASCQMLVHNSGASCRCEMQNAKSHPSQFARMPRFLTKSTLGSETPCRFLCPDAQGYPLGNSRMHFCILLSPGGWGGLCRREICHIGSFASNKSGMPLRIPFGFLTCQGTSARKFLKVVPHRLKLGIYCYCYVSARRLVTIFLARFLIKECFSQGRASRNDAFGRRAGLAWDRSRGLQNCSSECRSVGSSFRFRAPNYPPGRCDSYRVYRARQTEGNASR